MANDLVPYSQALSDPATTASSLESTDVIAIAREDSARPTGFKSMVTRLLTLAKKIVSGIDYSTELTETDAKTITGAINEVAQNSGSVDITTAINTPASVQTFSDGGDNIPLKSLVTEIVPVQSGSGVPSPQNVRAISGHSNCNVYIGNGVPKSYTIEAGQINQTTGADETSTTVSRTSYIAILPSQLIKITFETSTPYSRSYRLFWYGVNGETDYIGTDSVSVGADLSTITKQAPNNAYFVRIHATNGNMSFVFTLTAFNITTIPLGQTVYGGSLECVEGEGQSTHKMLTENDFTSYQPGPTSGGLSYVITPTSQIKAKNKTNGISNMLPISTSSWSSTTPCFELNAGQSPNIFAVRIVGSFTSLEDFKTQYAGLQICYEMVTPDDISVSGANIPTLSGVNNIYTDCGDIQSLEYFNENGDDIASLVRLMTRT